MNPFVTELLHGLDDVRLTGKIGLHHVQVCNLCARPRKESELLFVITKVREVIAFERAEPAAVVLDLLQVVEAMW